MNLIARNLVMAFFAIGTLGLGACQKDKDEKLNFDQASAAAFRLGVRITRGESSEFSGSCGFKISRIITSAVDRSTPESVQKAIDIINVVHESYLRETNYCYSLNDREASESALYAAVTDLQECKAKLTQKGVCF